MTKEPEIIWHWRAPWHRRLWIRLTCHPRRFWSRLRFVLTGDCGNACDWVEPYGWAPEAGCPVHDRYENKECPTKLHVSTKCSDTDQRLRAKLVHHNGVIESCTVYLPAQKPGDPSRREYDLDGRSLEAVIREIIERDSSANEPVVWFYIE
jgi:hypothetical protein